MCLCPNVSVLDHMGPILHSAYFSFKLLNHRNPKQLQFYMVFIPSISVLIPFNSHVWHLKRNLQVSDWLLSLLHLVCSVSCCLWDPVQLTYLFKSLTTAVCPIGGHQQVTRTCRHEYWCTLTVPVLHSVLSSKHTHTHTVLQPLSAWGWALKIHTLVSTLHCLSPVCPFEMEIYGCWL